MPETYVPRHMAKTPHEMNRSAHDAAGKFIDDDLKNISFLDDSQKKTLRECYLQKNTIESAAYKLMLDPDEVRVLYYRLSMDILRDCMKPCLERNGQQM